MKKAAYYWKLLPAISVLTVHSLFIDLILGITMLKRFLEYSFIAPAIYLIAYFSFFNASLCSHHFVLRYVFLYVLIIFY